MTRTHAAQPQLQFTAPSRSVGAVDGALALADRLVEPALRTGPRLRAAGDPSDDVRVWAGHYAQAVLEAIDGERPVNQLARTTHPSVYADLDRRVRLTRQARGGRRREQRSFVRSVHVCHPADGVAEVSVHVHHGQRSRAIALRLEHRGGRWLCVVMQFS